MSSNYRKSAGRLGEEGSDDGVNRPPARPSIDATIGLKEIKGLGLDETSVTFSEDDGSDPILARTFCPTSIFGEDDDMSSLGDETVTAAYRNTILVHALPPDLPYDQPMTDDQWKAIIMAATMNPSAASEHTETTRVAHTTSKYNYTRDDQHSSVRRSVHIIEDDEAGINEKDDVKNSPDEKYGLDRTKESVANEGKRNNGVGGIKKKKQKKKSKEAKKTTERSERRKLNEKRHRKKFPDGEGESSVSIGDPSSPSRIVHGDSKKRVKKKIRKTARSSSPQRRSGTTRGRSRSQSIARKPPLTSSTNGERKSKPATKRKKRISDTKRRSRSVDAQEIIDFVSNTKNIDSEHHHAGRTRKSTRITKHQNERTWLNDAMSSTDEVICGSPQTISGNLEPARHEAATPQKESRRDALDKKRQSKNEEMSRDRKIDSRGKNNSSLEFVIASKPKARTTNGGDRGNRNKNQPLAAVLVQKMWGSVSGGIRRDRSDKTAYV